MSIFQLTPANRIAATPDSTASGSTAVGGAAESFWNAAGQTDGYAPLDFDRCVDWLLDLYQQTQDQELRLLVSDVLDELRLLGPVEGEFEEVVLGAVASVEIAFEIKELAR